MHRRISIAALLLVANMALADDRPVVVEEHQTVVQVNGVVCSFCAYGAEKALSELDGLDKAEFGNGVLIDIDTHRITLAMRPGEKIPFREIYQRIVRAGYDPITLYVRAQGTLSRTDGMLLLRDAESDQVFRIIGGEIDGAAEPGDEGSHTPGSVSVQARVAASQIPKLSADGVVDVTIDRLFSD